jgi:zinc transporter ZupT
MESSEDAHELLACCLLGLVLLFAGHKLVLAQVRRLCGKAASTPVGTLSPGLVAAAATLASLGDGAEAPHVAVLAAGTLVYVALAGLVPLLHLHPGRQETVGQCGWMLAGLLLGTLG